MEKASHPINFHLWFPNIFEFKGGIQVYLRDLLEALIEDLPNSQLTIYNKLDRADHKNEFYLKNVLFYFYGDKYGFWQTMHFTYSLLKGALTNKPNLILCGHINFSPVAFLIHRLTGIPYWIFVYGVDAWLVKSPITKKALRAANQVVSISGYTRDRLINEQDLPLNKIALLPVTVDSIRFKISAKPDYLTERYGLQSERKIILTVARLANSEQYKGYDKILQALPEIRLHIPNVHYILVGKGDDRPRIEQLIGQLRLQDCVTLAGFIPDDELCDHYNLCDVFAMPSKGEGFGIVYLEALACGKPTLGGNQDGAIDALCHGELGVLVDPDNLSAIAQTLIQILQGRHPHPLLYQPEVLRQRVIETFGFEQFKRTLAQILENSIS